MSCSALIRSLGHTYIVYYRIYKQEHRFELIYNDLPDRYLRSIVNFRLCNTQPPIEKGCWMDLEPNDKKYYPCNLNWWWLHHILKCPYINCDQNNFIPHVNTNIANIYIFKKIMTDINLDNMINLCKFFESVLKGDI